MFCFFESLPFDCSAPFTGSRCRQRDLLQDLMAKAPVQRYLFEGCGRKLQTKKGKTRHQLQLNEGPQPCRGSRCRVEHAASSRCWISALVVGGIVQAYVEAVCTHHHHLEPPKTSKERYDVLEVMQDFCQQSGTHRSSFLWTSWSP